MIVNKLRIFFDIDYKTGIEYWIPISEIKIKNMFFATPPSYLNIEENLIILLSMVSLVLLSLTGILN